MTEEPPIRFFSLKDAETAYLSNFWGAREDDQFVLIIDGLDWPSVEHYYQAAKFDSPEMRELIRAAETPFAAKQIARGRKWRTNKATGAAIDNAATLGLDKLFRRTWDDERNAVMLKAVRKKFEQNAHLATRLKSTGERPLQEASPYDAYWGIGKRGTGENHLGRILQIVRSELV